MSVAEIDRRETGYYSTPTFVAEFVAKRVLELRPHAKFVFDPCVGQGELTAPFKARGCHTTGYDIVDMARQGCDEFIKGDFLKAVMAHDPSPLFRDEPLRRIDAIVANPPYNCHEVDYIRSQKTQLSARFGKATALNMYALFIRAILEYAPEGSVIALVTHDSFLTASGHKELRHYILETCRIHNLHLCPTNLFLTQGADVRTCVLVLEKTRMKRGKVKVSNRPASIDEFRRILQSEAFQEYPLESLLLGDARDSSEFAIGVPKEITALFGERRLSEVAPCITGISTGEDRKYIRSERSKDFSIPFYKNPASRKFYAAPDGYLCSNYDEVGRTVSNFMIRNKELIFRGGLSCSSMGVKFGATIRPERSACGVNPNVIIEDERRWWLLSFLNSRLCLYVTKGIIIRGNMITAGYASRIPVPQFDEQTLQLLGRFGIAGFEAARSGNSIADIKIAIDCAIEDALGLSRNTKSLLSDFEQDPTRLA